MTQYTQTGCMYTGRVSSDRYTGYDGLVAFLVQTWTDRESMSDEQSFL